MEICDFIHLFKKQLCYLAILRESTGLEPTPQKRESILILF